MRQPKVMNRKDLIRWKIALSWVALGLAAGHLVVASGVATMPPPATSEGGLLAGVFYALYYAVPLAILGVGLRSGARSILTLLGLFALGLVVLHSAPLFNFGLPFHGQPWQRSLAVVLSALSGMVEAMIFVVAFATVLGAVPWWHPGKRSLDPGRAQ